MLKQQYHPQELKATLADFGFESHEDYSFAVKQLYRPNNKINCLHLCGDGGRRKTAFAHALGNTLDFEHTFYHDFSQQTEPEPQLILPEPKDKDTPRETPISALDRVVSDACAFSEAENTLLVFDQLQQADYRHQVRIYQLITTMQWQYPKNRFHANPDNLFILLISEDTLYHALQKVSFRLWIGQAGYHPDFPSATELQRDNKIQPVLDALAKVFKQLKITPTPGELKNILQDIEHIIHTETELAHSIYGWTEGIEREQLYQPEILQLLNQVLREMDIYFGIEQLEI